MQHTRIPSLVVPSFVANPLQLLENTNITTIKPSDMEKAWWLYLNATHKASTIGLLACKACLTILIGGAIALLTTVALQLFACAIIFAITNLILGAKRELGRPLKIRNYLAWMRKLQVETHA